MGCGGQFGVNDMLENVLLLLFDICFPPCFVLKKASDRHVLSIAYAPLVSACLGVELQQSQKRLLAECLLSFLPPRMNFLIDNQLLRTSALHLHLRVLHLMETHQEYLTKLKNNEII